MSLFYRGVGKRRQGGCVLSCQLSYYLIIIGRGIALIIDLLFLAVGIIEIVRRPGRFLFLVMKADRIRTNRENRVVDLLRVQKINVIFAEKFHFI